MIQTRAAVSLMLSGQLRDLGVSRLRATRVLILDLRHTAAAAQDSGTRNVNRNSDAHHDAASRGSASWSARKIRPSEPSSIARGEYFRGLRPMRVGQTAGLARNHAVLFQIPN